MTLTRKLIIAFWVFIVFMIGYQLYTFDQATKQAAIEHPRQTQFIFLHTNAVVTSSAPARPDGPDVEQTDFKVENNVPSAGSFTCHVTVKNKGNIKAINVQVSVRPYRGTSKFDEDVGHTSNKVLSDDDPAAQFGDWLNFPDLAPGESSTQSETFINRADAKPGTNPKPEIIFQAEKVPAAQPPTTH